MSLPSATYLSKKKPAFPLVNTPELLVPSPPQFSEPTQTTYQINQIPTSKHTLQNHFHTLIKQSNPTKNFEHKKGTPTEVPGGRFIGPGCDLNSEVQIQLATHWPNEFLGCLMGME